MEHPRRLGKQGLGSGKQATQRQIITLALLENYKRSDRAISKVVGCDNETVARVRMTLEAAGQIERWKTPGSMANPMLTPKIKMAFSAGARMSETYATRIADLEAENARLRARIAELEQRAS